MTDLIGKLRRHISSITDDEFQSEWFEEIQQVRAKGDMNSLLWQFVIDKTDGATCRIIDTTENSVCVWIRAKSPAGISASNWFDEKAFHRRFNIFNLVDTEHEL